MKHDKKLDEMLMLYFFNELSEPKKKAFEIHLKECAHCQTELSKLKIMNSKLADTPDKVPTPELIEKVNMKIMAAIAPEPSNSLINKITDSFQEFYNSMLMAFTRPQYQFASMGATLIIGILIGKIWLSSGLQNDPEMLISLINRQSDLTAEQQSKFRNAFANYMIQSGDVELSELVQENPTDSQNDNMVMVNFKVKKDFALKGGLDNQAIQNMLRFSARHEKEPARRMRAVKLLSNSPQNKDIEETLIAVLLHDENESIRKEAMEAICQYNDSEESKDALKTVVLNDTSATLRIQAINFLKEIGSEDVIPIIALTSIRDNDEEVKNIAKNVLEELENSKSKE